MKTFAVIATLLVASLGLTNAEEHHHHHHHHAKLHVRTHDHVKATPWEATPSVKAAKCQDLCELSSWWTFQQFRNCKSTPSAALCKSYNDGVASIKTVITVAECKCT